MMHNPTATTKWNLSKLARKSTLVHSLKWVRQTAFIRPTSLRNFTRPIRVINILSGWALSRLASRIHVSFRLKIYFNLVWKDFSFSIASIFSYSGWISSSRDKSSRDRKSYSFFFSFLNSSCHIVARWPTWLILWKLMFSSNQNILIFDWSINF